MTVAADAVTASERAPKPEFLTQTLFEHFDLPPQVTQGLSEAGFVQCTPIQAQVLPVALTGRDIAGQAQTGTGKTAAFLVTVLSRLLSMPDRKPNTPSAIIVAPTRELAAQIYEEAMVIGRHTTLTFAQIVGGVDYQKQAALLRHGVDVVICTPGRIIDYFKQGVFKTDDITIAVIDEADRLLDLGFAKDMRFLLRKLPRYDKRQSMLFSATLSYRVLELTYEYMNLPEFISVTPQEIAVDGIEQSLFHVGKEKKLPLLLGLLKREDWHRILIFANTKSGVEWLAQKLKGNGYPAEGITGDLPQKKRFRLMEQFKNNEVKILVATDVASRGIHIEDISHVINYDLPQDSENYVHRIGRTARAGKTGRALSLACETYVLHLEPIEQMLGFKIPVVWPEDDWYGEDVAGPVKVAFRAKPPGRAAAKRPGTRKPKEKSTGKAPSSLMTPTGDPRPPGYFPGTFFGFLPESETDPSKGSISENASEESPPTPTEKGDSTGKKRRRRRRKKKASAPPAGDSQESAPSNEQVPDDSAPRSRRPRRTRQKPSPIQGSTATTDEAKPAPTPSLKPADPQEDNAGN
ncbi:MAG: DEAD/DEAH box helicase [Desulfobacterales bacterium]|jgi:ATP-dependent RNA helicase RhlB